MEEGTEAPASGESLQVEANFKVIPGSDNDAKGISKHMDESVRVEAAKSKFEELKDEGAADMLEVHQEGAEDNIIKDCSSKKKAKKEARDAAGVQAKGEPCVSATNESSGGEDSNGKNNPCESGGESLQVEANFKVIPGSDNDAKGISKHMGESVTEEAVKSRFEELEDKGAADVLEVHQESSEHNIIKDCSSKRKAKKEARGAAGVQAKGEPCISATNESRGGEDSNGKKNPCESGATGISGVDDWLPEGWVVEVRTRQVGGSAGSRDKYYRHPMVARCFRSKNEVLTYIESGQFPQKRRKCPKDAPSMEKSKEKPERKKRKSKNSECNRDPTQVLIKPPPVSAGREELSTSLRKTTNQASKLLLPEIPCSSSGATQNSPTLTLSEIASAFSCVTQSPPALALPEFPSAFSGFIQNPSPLGVLSMEWQSPHRRAKLPVVSRKASKLVVDSTRPVGEDASLGFSNGKALIDTTISSESQMIKPALLDNTANEISSIDNVKEEVICNSVQQVWLGLFFSDEQVASDTDGNQNRIESNKLGLKVDDFDIELKEGKESRVHQGGF